ncbi:MAG: hypothetical protein ACLR5H_10500 [Oscillospiraceae bacterium]
MLYFRCRQLLRPGPLSPGRRLHHRRRWRLAGLPQDRHHSGPAAGDFDSSAPSPTSPTSSGCRWRRTTPTPCWR